MIEVRRGADRFGTLAEGRTTWHSFSFGAHYDPGNVGFGPLLAHNDELLPPGTGYPEHHHAGVEILTWVRSGQLRHRSSAGTAVIGPGQVQRLSAGSGVVHSEHAEGAAGVRFLQAWLHADDPSLEPSYATVDAPAGPGWVRVAGPEGGVLSLGVAGAILDRGLLRAGATLTLPGGPMQHLFVVTGSVLLGEETLATDDAVRLRAEGPHELTALGAAEVLVWRFSSSPG